MADQSNHAKVRTARSLSMLSVVIGVGMLIVFLSSGGVGGFGGFGVLWVVVLLAMVGYHFMNATGGENRPSLYEI